MLHLCVSLSLVLCVMIHFIAAQAATYAESGIVQVGVMHTNYRELGRRIAGPLVVPFLHAMVATLCAIHCHKVCLPPCPPPPFPPLPPPSPTAPSHLPEH